VTWESSICRSRYSQRLADNGVVASDGSKGDNYDNSMIESFNGLYKWELIYPHGPWQGFVGGGGLGHEANGDLWPLIRRTTLNSVTRRSIE
jgi:transposase InsO family protein